MKQLYMKLTIVLLAIACLVLAIDKTRMASRLNNISDRIAEKAHIIEENEARYQDNIAMVEATLADLEQRFSVILPSEAADTGDMNSVVAASAQIPLLQDDLAAAEKIAAGLPVKDPQSVVNAVNAYLSSEIPNAEKEFQLDPESGRVISRGAALLEETARRAGLSVSTVLYWDVHRFAAKAETAVSFPAAASAPVAAGEIPASQPLPVRRVFGVQIKNAAYSVSQFLPATTSFPFDDLMLLSSGEKILVPEGQFFPIGGLYVHYFRVSSKGEWFLEYEFDAETDPDLTNLRALSLLPGSTIATASSGKVQTFRITPQGNDSVFLVIADHPFFPKKISTCLSSEKFNSMSPLIRRNAPKTPIPSKTKKTVKRKKTVKISK